MIIPRRFALSAALALLVLVYGTPAAAQKSGPPGSSGREQLPPEEPPPPYPELPAPVADSVRTALREYVAAATRRDGEAAARFVTRGTRDYYARMRDMAVSAPEAQVRAAPLIDRVSILLMRHRIPAGELRAVSGDAVFAYTVTQGWLGSDLRLPAGATVYGEGDQAVIRIVDTDARFVREDGAWRWDMMPIIHASSAMLAPDPADGMTEDEFIILVLEAGSGRKVPPTIWQPLP